MDERIKRSRAQEKRGMESIGGRQTSRSGANWWEKNDGRVWHFLVEYKRTDLHKSITLRHTDLRDAENNALAEGRVMALGFELMGRDYFVFTAEDVADMGVFNVPSTLLRANPEVDEASQMPGRRRTPGAPVLSRGRPSEYRSRQRKGNL